MAERKIRLTKSEKQDKEILDRLKVATVKPEEIKEVFDYWVSVHKAESKRKPILDVKRRRLLAISIFDFGVDGCKEAIDGCANSHFHMGQNKRGKIYNSLELIFRSVGDTERFIGYNE